MRKIFLICIFFAISRLYASGGPEIISHIVQPNETVFRLSLIYNSTVDDIIRANPGLKPTEMLCGISIKVPKNTEVRDSAAVAAFFKSAYGVKLPALKEGQHDETPFTRATGQGKTIDQIIKDAAHAKATPQSASTPALNSGNSTSGTGLQPYSSEDLQSRYLELRNLASYDKSVKVIDISSIKVSTENTSSSQ